MTVTPRSLIEQHQRRWREACAEHARLARWHRRWMAFVCGCGAVLFVLVILAVGGMAWWAWTGQHPFGGW